MSFFERYFDYIGIGEAPALYHRWSSLSIVGAIIGRKLYIPFGHSNIYPNMYVQLMGAPGTRKSTAIGAGKKLLKEAGYTRFAADRVSKERFLMEMKQNEEDDFEKDLTTLAFDAPAETFVVAEEFGDFIGPGNMEFATMLTKLWDNQDSYTHPKIHGKSISVEKPTVNILSGNTPQGLALTVPPEALGNGFMSRMIFVYAKETGRKITFPVRPQNGLKESLAEHLVLIRDTLHGEVTFNQDASKILDRIYKNYIGVDDPRFTSYSTRRFTHLLKLCIIIAAMDLRTEVVVQDCLEANTILHHTETKMPSALGEFGRSKYSDVSNTLSDALQRTDHPLTFHDLWKLVAKDLTKTSELAELLKNMMLAQKIQTVTMHGKQGYMPMRVVHKEWENDLLLPEFLTVEEMML